MSQIYKEMNKTGKGIFWVAISFIFGGTGLSLMFDGLNLKLGLLATIVGFYYLQWSMNDIRLNIKNDTKGNPLSQGEYQ